MRAGRPRALPPQVPLRAATHTSIYWIRADVLCAIARVLKLLFDLSRKGGPQQGQTGCTWGGAWARARPMAWATLLQVRIF